MARQVVIAAASLSLVQLVGILGKMKILVVAVYRSFFARGSLTHAKTGQKKKLLDCFPEVIIVAVDCVSINNNENLQNQAHSLYFSEDD